MSQAFTAEDLYLHRKVTELDASPDARQLAFLSSRGASAQVHVMSTDCGEPAPLAQLPGAVSDPPVREDAAQRIVDWVRTHVQRAPAPLPEEAQQASAKSEQVAD